MKVAVISGSLSTKKRDAEIEQFKNDPSIDILLMSPVGQQGLNLTAASVIILFVRVCKPGSVFRRLLTPPSTGSSLVDDPGPPDQGQTVPPWSNGTCLCIPINVHEHCGITSDHDRHE